jgi:hypothetical protein
MTRGRTVRRLLVDAARCALPLAVLACREGDPLPRLPVQPPPPLCVPAASAIASASAALPAPSPPDASSTESDEKTSGPADLSLADDLRDALSDRRVFREIMTGIIVRTPSRTTWVLSRSPTRTRLRLYGQSGSGAGRRLDGPENDEHAWGAPCVTRYDGTPDGTLSYAFTREAPFGATPDAAVRASIPKDAGRPACVGMPDTFRLQCKTEDIKVLRAGAILLNGACENVWQGWAPPTTTRVRALRCDVLSSNPDAKPARHHDDGCSHGDHGTDSIRDGFSDGTVVFAPATATAPGVEWVFENSDCWVQEGGFRFMPMPQ